MSKRTDLKNALLSWKEHFSSDVVGQSLDESHLSEDTLMSMIQTHTVTDEVPIADIDHLSSCPDCLSRWARLCKTVDKEDSQQDSASPTMAYGTLDEDDVCGQSADIHLKSHCQNFTLTLSISPDDPHHGDLIMETTVSQLEGRPIQVRDKAGQLLLDGLIEDGKITVEEVDPQELDLSIWTVIVGEPPLHQG